MTIQEKLLRAIEDRGLSVAETARRAKLHQPRLNTWLNGQGRFFWEQVVAVARVLDVSLDWLASNDDDVPALPTERERQVRELIDKFGWEWAYWKIQGQAAPVSPPAPRHPSFDILPELPVPPRGGVHYVEDYGIKSGSQAPPAAEAPHPQTPEKQPRRKRG